MNELERLSRHSKQHEELGADLKEKNREIEELNNDAQELVDLVETKEKVIEELKNSLVEARNCVSAMEEEIRSKRANKAEAVDEECGSRQPIGSALTTLTTSMNSTPKHLASLTKSNVNVNRASSV